MSRMPVSVRRDKLIDAAMTVMARDGVSRTTTRSIVTEAGMTTGSFHYCFFSKEELELEVMRILNGRAYDPVVEQASVEGPDVIERVVGAYVDSLVADPQRRQLAFELTLHGLREPGLKDEAVKHYEAKVEATERFLARVATSGRFSWRLPHPELARLTLSMAEGMAYQWLATEQDATKEELHDCLVGLLQTQVAPADHGSEPRADPPSV